MEPLNEIIVQDNEQQLVPETKIKSGETQIIVIIGEKEYTCFAIEIQKDRYLIFTDNEITKKLIESNTKIVAIEENEQKNLELFPYHDIGFLQKEVDQIKVTLVNFYGLLKIKNIIEYNENYFKNSKNNNYLLKDYEWHLNEFENIIKDFKEEEERRRNNSRNCCPDDVFFTSIFLGIIALICVVLGIIFPAYGKFLLFVLEFFS